jgi:hypothetical protein
VSEYFSKPWGVDSLRVVVVAALPCAVGKVAALDGCGEGGFWWVLVGFGELHLVMLWQTSS